MCWCRQRRRRSGQASGNQKRFHDISHFGASNEGSAWVTHRACQRFLTEASGTNKGGIQCNSFGGSLCASSGHLLSTTLLARPTRFELVTSAFGGPRGVQLS